MGAAPPCTPPCSRCSLGAPPRLRSRCATVIVGAAAPALPYGARGLVAPLRAVAPASLRRAPCGGRGASALLFTGAGCGSPGNLHPRRQPSAPVPVRWAVSSPPPRSCGNRFAYASRPGSVWGPGGLIQPPSLSRVGLLKSCAHTRHCVRRCGRGLRPSALSARFLRRARPALGPLRRAPCVPRPVPRAPPAPRFAAPVRRLAPSALFGPRRGRASLAAPPLPRSGARRAGALPRPLAGPVCLWARPCCAAGARRLALVALASRGLGPCAARGPAGGLLRAPSGFGPGGLPPPPPVAGWRPPFFAWGAGAFWLRARACPRLPSGSWCAAAAAALLGLAWLLWLCFALAGARHRCSPRRATSGSRVGFSPAPLPSPPPPLGAPGSAWPPAMGLPPRRCAAPLRVRLLPGA